MCAYTMKARWKVGQASHRAYYGNKAAFHFLGKTAAATARVPDTIWLMTEKIERKIHRNCITRLLFSWEVLYDSH